MVITALQKRSEINKAYAQFQVDSDSACYRTISPLVDDLAQCWDLLGGGKNAGAVRDPSPEWHVSVGRFEQAYYQVTFFDPVAERLLKELFNTTRAFWISTVNLNMYRSHSPMYGNEIKTLQDERTDLTEKFRNIYKEWKVNMRNTVGMHRVEAYGPTTPTLPHDLSATVSVPHNPAAPPATTSYDEAGIDDA